MSKPLMLPTLSRVTTLSLLAMSVSGQISNIPAAGGKLASVIPVGAAGLTASFPSSFGPTIGAQVAQSLNLSSFYSGLAAELSNLPASSSASALRYAFDPSVGAYVPSAQSLGPILTERAETIGKDKLFLGITFQRFKFDTQDGVDLKNFTAKLPLEIPANGPAVATANVGIRMSVDEVTAHLTYGITPWLDVSYALSTLTNSLSFEVNATIVPVSGMTLSGAGGAHGTSSGLGDGVARLKAKLLDKNGLAMAIATDIRVPTGDEFNLQGGGAYGVKPFFIASYASRAFSPHLNLGYQWNGKSYLASSDTLEKERLPSQLLIAGGADIAVSRRLTLAFDALDQVVIHGPGIQSVSQSIDGITYQFIDFRNRTRHEVSGAAGLKVLLTRNIVLTGDLLIRLNDAGLRSEAVPLVGLSYLF